jgi:hypothetical protein
MYEPNAPTYIKEDEEEDIDLSGLSIKLIIEDNIKA